MNALTLMLAMAVTMPPTTSLNGSTIHLQTGPGGGGRGPREGAPPATTATDTGKPDDASFAAAVKDYDKKSGVVDAYLKGETILFAVPKKKIGRDFLWYIELKKTPAGSCAEMGASGSGDGVCNVSTHQVPWYLPYPP